MSLASAVVSARHTAQQITWAYSDGSAVDLTGATLAGRLRNVYTGVERAIDGSLSLYDAVNGVFTWTYGVNDVSEAGLFEVQFTADYTGGDLEKSIPENWRVYEDLST